jgi:hypothetical protein
LEHHNGRWRGEAAVMSLRYGLAANNNQFQGSKDQLTTWRVTKVVPSTICRRLELSSLETMSEIAI